MPKIGEAPRAKMLRLNTPVEYHKKYGLWVKREDLACPPPGPPFSKTRGVFEHVRKRLESLIGVLDTSHSQAGHAVARACQILGKKCINYYPVYKTELDDNDPPQHELRLPQIASQDLGAELHGLPAGRSCILFHRAKKDCQAKGGYMMPNALKLEESVEETAKEVDFTRREIRNPDLVIIPASSGTIAAGVIRGFGPSPRYVIHLGYSRSQEEVARYLSEKSGVKGLNLQIVDEGYAYKDQSKPGETPPWPCNVYYDLKAFRWWMQNRHDYFAYRTPLFWNIG